MPKTSSSCNGYLNHYVLFALSLFYILNEGVGKVSFKENVFVFEWGCPDSDLSECIPVRVVIKKKTYKL